MPGEGLGVLGGSKTLAWGFVMAPHQLRLLVLILIIAHDPKLFRKCEEKRYPKP